MVLGSYLKINLLLGFLILVVLKLIGELNYILIILILKYLY